VTIQHESLPWVEVEKAASTAAAAAEQSRMESAQQVVALADQAHTASAHAQEIEKRAEDLKTALMAAQASQQRLTAELEAERHQHGATREQSNAVSTELMTVKARAEAQAEVQFEQVERLKRVEADLAAARGAAATAREETAQLRGQAEALQAQHAHLIEGSQHID
jgi:chromosome segregation ATPase